MFQNDHTETRVWFPMDRIRDTIITQCWDAETFARVQLGFAAADGTARSFRGSTRARRPADQLRAHRQVKPDEPSVILGRTTPAVTGHLPTDSWHNCT